MICFLIFFCIRYFLSPSKILLKPWKTLKLLPTKSKQKSRLYTISRIKLKSNSMRNSVQTMVCHQAKYEIWTLMMIQNIIVVSKKMRISGRVWYFGSKIVFSFENREYHCGGNHHLTTHTQTHTTGVLCVSNRSILIRWTDLLHYSTKGKTW